MTYQFDNINPNNEKQLSLMAGSTELWAGQHSEHQAVKLSKIDGRPEILLFGLWWILTDGLSEDRDPRKSWLSLVLGPTRSGTWVPAPQNDKRILPQKWLQKNSKTHKSVPLHGIL